MTGAARFVSVAPSWGVLQRAGIGVLGLGGGADGGGGGGAALLTHVLFAASTVVLWLNIYAVWRRRAAIVARGIQTDWRVVVRLVSVGTGHNIAAHVAMLSPNAPPFRHRCTTLRARAFGGGALSFFLARWCVRVSVVVLSQHRLDAPTRPLNRLVVHDRATPATTRNAHFPKTPRGEDSSVSHHRRVAFTFPSCSSAVAAMQYSAPRGDPASPPGLAPPLRAALRAYALALTAVVLSAVGLIAVLMARKLARAFVDEVRGLSPRDDGVEEEGEGEAGEGDDDAKGITCKHQNPVGEQPRPPSQLPKQAGVAWRSEANGPLPDEREAGVVPEQQRAAATCGEEEVKEEAPPAPCSFCGIA